ncbi:hypothetical protein D3C86_2207430 [compost metagenome]
MPLNSSRGERMAAALIIDWLGGNSSHLKLPSFIPTLILRDSPAMDLVVSTPGNSRRRHSSSSTLRKIG